MPQPTPSPQLALAACQVYDATREAAEWARLLQPRQSLSVHCLHLFNNSNVTNSQLVQRRVRDAVCDAVRDARWAPAHTHTCTHARCARCAVKRCANA